MGQSEPSTTPIGDYEVSQSFALGQSELRIVRLSVCLPGPLPNMMPHDRAWGSMSQVVSNLAQVMDTARLRILPGCVSGWIARPIDFIYKRSRSFLT